MTAFTHVGVDKHKVCFASPYPGKIIPLDLSELGGKVVCQKDAFLCAAKGTQVGIEFSKTAWKRIFRWRGFHYAKDRRRWHGFHACWWTRH